MKLYLLLYVPIFRHSDLTAHAWIDLSFHKTLLLNSIQIIFSVNFKLIHNEQTWNIKLYSQAVGNNPYNNVLKPTMILFFGTYAIHNLLKPLHWFNFPERKDNLQREHTHLSWITSYPNRSKYMRTSRLAKFSAQEFGIACLNLVSGLKVRWNHSGAKSGLPGQPLKI